MKLTRNSTIVSTTLLIAVFAFLYFFTGVFGETRINLTLRTNPDLEDGLVGHWTFDSGDVSGVSVLDSSGNGNNGYLVATSSVPAEVAADSSIEEEDGNLAHINSSPNTVWTDENNGFVFYLEDIGSALESIYMASTSDGGATWGNSQTVTGQNDDKGVTVWYDKWTRGKTTNLIHILTWDSGQDDFYYATYDPDTNTMSSSVRITNESDDIGYANYASLVEAEDGTLYATLTVATGDRTYYCSSSCDAGTGSWTKMGDAGYTEDVTSPNALLPLQGTDNVVLIEMHRSSPHNIYSNIYSATSSSWWGSNTVVSTEAYHPEGEMSATVNPLTGDIYLAYIADANDFTVEDHHIEVYKFDHNTYTWSQLTSPTGVVSGGLVDVGIGVDSKRGYLYVSYARRTTIGTAATGNIYWTKSTDDGQSWLSEQGPINSSADEFIGVRSNFFSPDAMSVTVTDQTAHAIYVYKLEDITDYADEKPVPGNIGQGLHFDGVDDRAYFGDIPTTNAMSWAFWIKLDSIPTIVPLFDKYRTAGSGREYRSYYNTGEVRLQVSSDGTTWEDNGVANVGLSVGEWAHVVVIFDNGEFDVFKNGEYMGNSQFTTHTSLNNSSTELQLGGRYTDSNFFPGSIDDFRVYNKRLATSTITRLYGLGATTHVNTSITTNPNLENGLVGHWTFDGDLTQQITDLSGNGNNGYLVTVGEATSTKIVPGAIGQGLTFDGTDDYADLGDSSELDFGSSDFTVSVWGKRHELSTSYDNQWAVNKWKSGGSAGQNEFNLGFGCASGSDYPCFTVESGTTYYTATSSIEIADTNAWHLLTGVREGSDIKVYVDGVLGDTLNYGGGAINNAGRTFRVAQSANTASFFTNASFDDIRLYNRALSSEEVSRLYDLGGTTHVNTTITTNPDLKNGLVAHWSFDGSFKNGVSDVSGNGHTGYFLPAAYMTTTTAATLGLLGQAITLSGADQEMYELASSDFSFGTGDMSAFAWVYVRSADDPSGERIMNDRGRGTSVPGWQLKIKEDTNNWGFYDTVINHSGGTAFGCNSGFCDTNRYAFNKWYHVGLVWDNNGSSDVLRLYVDGELATSTTATGNVDSISNSIPLEIGGTAYNNGSPSTFEQEFDGKIDDVRIYNRALSSEEITRLYQLGQ